MNETMWAFFDSYKGRSSMIKVIKFSKENEKITYLLSKCK